MSGFNTPAITTNALRWMATALPLVLCVSIWLVGSEERLLTALHHAIGVAVLVWTAMRLARHPRGLRPSRWVGSMRERLAATRLSVVAIYSLLMLQPVLELAGRMVSGQSIVLWRMTVPPLLPVNAAWAEDLARAHGTNAVLLLGLIGSQVLAELYTALQERAICK